MKAYELRTGSEVTGIYYGEPYRGTVNSVRFHSCRKDGLVIDVRLDTPMTLNGYERDGVTIECNVETGGGEYDTNIVGVR